MAVSRLSSANLALAFNICADSAHLAFVLRDRGIKLVGLLDPILSGLREAGSEVRSCSLLLQEVNGQLGRRPTMDHHVFHVGRRVSPRSQVDVTGWGLAGTIMIGRCVCAI